MRIVSSAMSRAQGVYRRRGVVVTDYSPDRAIPDDAEGCLGGASLHGKVLSSPPARNPGGDLFGAASYRKIGDVPDTWINQIATAMTSLPDAGLTQPLEIVNLP